MFISFKLAVFNKYAYIIKIETVASWIFIGITFWKTEFEFIWFLMNLVQEYAIILVFKNLIFWKIKIRDG